MDSFLAESIRIAEHSLNSGGFPVGSIICVGDLEIGRGASSTESLNDVTAHAEVQAIRAAMQQSKGGTLYSSLEPCMMCLAACAWAGIKQVVFACSRSAVDQSYYETNVTAAELSRALIAPIKVIPDFARQDDVIALIRRWEEGYNH
jgi:guanine deaminase